MNPPFTYRPKSPSPNTGGYRYFFNGQEGDNEVFGEVANFGFEYRQYDSRLGRFWSVDPLAAKYPWNSTYAFAENSPIGFVELEGLERYWSVQGTKLGNVGNSSEIRVVNKNLVEQDVVEYIKLANSNDDPKTSNAYAKMLKDNSVTFSDYAEDIPDVLNNAKVVPYDGNCKDAAEKQMNNAGIYQSGPQNAIQMEVDKNRNPSLAPNPIGAMIYIMTQLKEGKPVMIGVMNVDEQNRKDVGNVNSNTSHFMVITRMLKSYGGGTPAFGYYDNASRQYGNHKDNLLVTDPNNEVLKGSTYQGTEVRKNVEK